MSTSNVVRPKPRKLAKPNGRSCKDRGYWWETQVVKLWKRLGCPTARRNGPIYGSNDRGDIGEIPLTQQCKNVDRIRFWENLDAALKQARINGTHDETCVTYNRHNRPTSEAAWVFPGSFAERLLAKYYELGGDSIDG